MGSSRAVGLHRRQGGAGIVQKLKEPYTGPAEPDEEEGIPTLFSEERLSGLLTDD